jgi:hypothetical protein
MTQQDTSLLNFKIPNQLKHDFHALCARNSTRMTTELIKMIREYVKRETVEQEAYDYRRFSRELSPEVNFYAALFFSFSGLR